MQGARCGVRGAGLQPQVLGESFAQTLSSGLRFRVWFLSELFLSQVR